MYLFFNDGDYFTLVHIETETVLESINGHKLNYFSYLSNHVTDNDNTNKLIVSNRVRSCMVEVTEDEFKKLIKERLEVAKTEILLDECFMFSGRLSVKTFL